MEEEALAKLKEEEEGVDEEAVEVAVDGEEEKNEKEDVDPADESEPALWETRKSKGTYF